VYSAARGDIQALHTPPSLAGSSRKNPLAADIQQSARVDEALQPTKTAANVRRRFASSPM
jgi:hypothetical protein